jgi:hypothetical protein
MNPCRASWYRSGRDELLVRSGEPAAGAYRDCLRGAWCETDSDHDRPSRRGRPVLLWVSGALPGLVHDKKAEWVWASCANSRPPGDHAGRQGLPGNHLGEDPVPGKEQTGIIERNQPRPRKAPRARRKGKCPAQELADPPQAPLLPLARRATRRGHPHPGDKRRVIRMKKGLLNYPEWSRWPAFAGSAVVEEPVPGSSSTAVIPRSTTRSRSPGGPPGWSDCFGYHRRGSC